jgi:hypothetical protein
MAIEAVRTVHMEVALETKDQTRDQVIAALDLILVRCGCQYCGLMGAVSASVAEKPTQK